MNIAETILSAGADSAPAITSRNTVVTYRELRQMVSGIACMLSARGHSKGERIGIFSENKPFFVAAYLGIIRAGLVAVPIQTDSMTGQAFKKIILEAGIRELMVSQRYLGQFRRPAQEMEVSLIGEDEIKANSVSEQAFPGIDPATDLAALMFTSGSTGAPKGVMVTHRNIECNTRDIISYVGLTSADRAMVVLPFNYCFGASLLHTHLMAGGSVVLNNDFKLFPEAMLQEMRHWECTGLAGVPSTYQILLRKSRFRQMTFPKLRWFQQAGGKLPNRCISEIRGSFPQVRYFLMYGQTEATARLSYLPPERLADKLGSIGKGLPSTKLAVLKPDGSPVSPGSDETGEIVASGDNITRGYWNDPAETARFFKKGRLHTGDIAKVDADGFIFIVERGREIIKSGGNRVSPKEIEDVIAELPEVVEVAVIGAPDELLGEAIKVFVALVPGAKLASDNISRHCRNRLPLFKVPGEVFLLENLPHNDSGKVLKAKLSEMVANRFAGNFGSWRLRKSETSPPPVSSA
jgi:acyl-CoA synthetase (AMP-forming)/AMP-acid ligase II